MKLLRALQERVVEPLGGEVPVPIDARVVATSTRDLAAEVAAGRFREDLYYRLAVVTLHVPPLRARRADLPALVEALAGRVAERARVAPRAFPPETLERLAEHAWPGNLRELENAVERVLVLGGGEGGEPEPVVPEELAFLARGLPDEAERIARDALAHGLSIEALGSGHDRGGPARAAREPERRGASAGALAARARVPPPPGEPRPRRRGRRDRPGGRSVTTHRARPHALRLALAALAVPLALAAGGRAQEDAGPAAGLADPDPARAQAAAAELRALGDEGEARVWEGFAAAGPHARRARARWVLENAGPASAAPAAERLADPDAAVRGSLARFLGRVEVPGQARARVTEALVGLAREETAAAVRAELGTALAALGGEQAVAGMLELVRLWPAPERTELALALAQERAAREAVLELVPRALGAGEGAGGEGELPPDVLGALLPAYGRALADRPGGGDTPRERAPLLIGMRHPAPAVRLGAGGGARRARPAAGGARAHRARRPAPRGARRRGRRPARGRAPPRDPRARTRARPRARAGRGERARAPGRPGRSAPRPALALPRPPTSRARTAIVAGLDARARAAMERAEGVLEGLLAERADLATEGGREDQHDLLQPVGPARAPARRRTCSRAGAARPTSSCSSACARCT